MQAFLVLTTVLFVAGYAGAEDCELGNRYLALAQDRTKSYAPEEAVAFLRKSIEVCPTYEAYQQMGELAAQSSEHEDKAVAAEAFVNAYELARSDPERANTLYQYAQLLNAAGDPQNAYPLVKAARTFDAANARILTLDEQLDDQIRNPTTDQLRAGLKGELYRPLRVASARNLARSAPVATSGSISPPASGAVNIPIHFVTGTTSVDDETRPNLGKLAQALANAEFVGTKFLLVGHADERGDEQMNMALSWKRATVTREILVRLEPSLAGRLELDGRGENEPLDPRNDESAYRTNRRIQVLPK
jgi:outer membrane protein OmpA-like peptidoglycan-associated protein